MNTSRFRLITLSTAISGMFLSSKANACGMCVAALFDSIMPPVKWWVLFAIFGFLGVSATLPENVRSIGFIPRIPRALLIILIFSLLGVMFFGPMLILLLLAPLAYAVIEPLFNKKYRIKEFLPLRRAAVAVLVGFTILSIQSAKIMMSRSPSAFILEWTNTFEAHRELAELIAGGAKNAAEVRIVAQKGTPSIALEAAQGLVRIGDPEIDIPLLARKLESCHWDYGSECDKNVLQTLQYTLENLEARKRLGVDVKPAKIGY